MTMSFSLDGPRQAPASGGAPQSIVVLLHGYGADGNDLISLAPLWGRLLPHTLFVSPHAPFPCEINPAGRQWFAYEGAPPETILAGTRAAAALIDSFLDDLLRQNDLTTDRMALAGFSQGAMMSLYVAPRRTPSLAGVLGFSGALIDAEHLADEAVSKPPVLLVHGDADPVIPFASLGQAASALRAAGFAVETEARPALPHAIDQVGMAVGGRFLARLLGAPDATVS